MLDVSGNPSPAPLPKPKQGGTQATALSSTQPHTPTQAGEGWGQPTPHKQWRPSPPKQSENPLSPTPPAFKDANPAWGSLPDRAMPRAARNTPCSALHLRQHHSGLHCKGRNFVTRHPNRVLQASGFISLTRGTTSYYVGRTNSARTRRHTCCLVGWRACSSEVAGKGGEAGGKGGVRGEGTPFSTPPDLGSHLERRAKAWRQLRVGGGVRFYI